MQAPDRREERLFSDGNGMHRHLDGSGGAGEGDECPCGLILHSRAGGLEQVINATDEAGSL